MDWHGIIIHTKNDAVDLIASMLYDIGVKGIEIIDPSLSDEEKEHLIVDYIDDGLIPTSNVKIICYFSSEENLDEKLEAVKQILEETSKFVDIGEGTVETILTKETDWADNWKKYYKPFRVGENIVIKPTWESLTEQKEGDIVIDIDPGMAFGSGTHETTSMCINHLQKYIKSNQHIIDVGCGSGILSIVAGKLGAKKVEAIDVDKAAVKVAAENVKLNNMEHIVTVSHGDLLDKTNEKADLVVANIMADIIIILMDDIKRVLKKGGILITSGIILDRKEQVKAKIESTGFEIIDITQDGEWVAISAKYNR